MGNHYCSSVKAMTISDFGMPGQFNMVTNMDSKQNKCDKDGQKSFGGGVSPLEEGISWHFRGPLNLKQFAAYTITGTSSKRSIKPGFQERRHGHAQYHRRGQTAQDAQNAADGNYKQKRDVCGMVTATIDGKVVSWTNNYKCTSATAAPAAPPPQAQNANNVNEDGSGRTVTVTITVSAVTTTSTTTVMSNNETSIASSAFSSSNSISTTVFSTSFQSNTVTVTDHTSSSSSSTSSQPVASSQSASLSSSQNASGSQATPTSSSKTSSDSSSTSSGNSAQLSAVAPVSGTWMRQAYYNADQQVADGLVFLNALGGGNGSGVFDYTFGSSMSYASPDVKSGAASPQCLANQMIEDNDEFTIVTDQDWEGSDGYTRPGTVAHKGFAGPMKLFLVEFDMPLTGKGRPDDKCHADCPAIWTLNHRIPFTQQYGKCNCWPACGELDIFEALDAGNTRLKATFHGINQGGHSDYFERPTDKTMKAAILFDASFNSVYILVLDDNVDIATSIPSSTVDQWVSNGQNDAQNFVNFKLPDHPTI